MKLKPGDRVLINAEYIRSMDKMFGLDETILATVEGPQVVEEVPSKARFRVTGCSYVFPIEAAERVK